MENLTKETFIEMIFDFEKSKEWEFKGNKPIIIDFYADFCGPCKIVSPILEEIEKEYSGKIDVYKVDTEEQQELGKVFGISSIPSILFIPLDDKPEMAHGALPKKTIKDAIKRILKVQ
jgi:thioredoxin 1